MIYQNFFIIINTQKYLNVNLNNKLLKYIFYLWNNLINLLIESMMELYILQLIFFEIQEKYKKINTRNIITDNSS